MTGYGRAAAVSHGNAIVVEIRTVNHRFLELKIRGLVGALEDLAAARVRSRFERGSVAVTVSVSAQSSARGEDAPAIWTMDRRLAEQEFHQLSALAAHLGLPPPGLTDLLARLHSIPDGLGSAQASSLDESAVVDLVDQAVAAAAAMRAAEGIALHRDVGARLTRLCALTAELEELARNGAIAIAERLSDRVHRVLAQLEPGVTLEASRLAQEVALIVDRSDITEELVRLNSHFEQCSELLVRPGAAGRRLEFLLQEMGREFNTVGAKSWSAAISSRVVEAKSELEKLREQAQNVE